MLSPNQLDSLWDFSLALYAQPEVADTCLRLQDEQGINVNLLLWCVWLECKGLALDDAHLHEAQRRIRGWDQHYVVPLRHLRRRMKAEFGTQDAAVETVRKHIQQAELAAEKELQMRLQRVTQHWLEQGNASESAAMASGFKGENLRRYLDQAGVNCGAIDTVVQCLTGVLRNI
ncbi:MAG TPA: TIGR02444 family protein [Cellvibrio sp.]